MSDVTDELRRILAAHGRLARDPAALTEQEDLYKAGMTSHASVNVMLAVEDAFDVEFPDELLKPSVFGSLAAIEAAVASLRGVETT